MILEKFPAFRNLCSEPLDFAQGNGLSARTDTTLTRDPLNAPLQNHAVLLEGCDVVPGVVEELDEEPLCVLSMCRRHLSRG